jgi:hypothetical protein
MNRKTMLGAAATAVLALSGTGIAVAAGGPGSAQAGGTTTHKSSLASARTATSCHGGAQKQTLTVINNRHSTFGEGGNFAVPAALVVSGPAFGKDTLNITLSAESQLRNSSANDHFDWMELEVRVDGVPIQPFGPPDSPLAFTGSKDYASNAAQFCTKIGPGRHRVTAVARLVDNGANDSLTGWLDDITLNAVRSE